MLARVVFWGTITSGVASVVVWVTVAPVEVDEVTVVVIVGILEIIYSSNG